MQVFFVIALLAISATFVSADNYAKFNLLKDDRAAGRLVFIPTSLAQKEVILSNVENARSLNMAPYGCFYATTEVEFAFIEGDVDIISKPTVVVTSTSEHPELLALFGKDYSKIEAGDELLAINGLSFVEWFQQNKFKYGFGANEFGGQRSALDYLTAISGEINRLPSEDFITFQFKSHDNPQNSYTVTVPYVSIHDDECWNIGSNLYKSITSITLPGTPETSLPVSTSSLDISQVGHPTPPLQGSQNG
ncbi:hypothetical protein BASA81_013525 [Batrachochytrium salamandrivorans]|nr:hypothetical protein BASA81_013525 [Batrachochytrium salamandrivorans]